MRAASRVIVLTVWMAACAGRAAGPPDIVVDRTACSYCRMLISELVHAAAYRTPDGGERVFDDVGCLLSNIRTRPPGGAQFWFYNAAGRDWIDGASAVFVTSRSLRTPMGGGTLAFGDRRAADAAAVRHGGTVVTTLADLLATDGSQR